MHFEVWSLIHLLINLKSGEAVLIINYLFLLLSIIFDFLEVLIEAKFGMALCLGRPLSLDVEHPGLLFQVVLVHQVLVDDVAQAHVEQPLADLVVVVVDRDYVVQVGYFRRNLGKWLANPVYSEVLDFQAARRRKEAHIDHKLRICLMEHLFDSADTLAAMVVSRD